MNIQAINNQTSFKAIYNSKNEKINDAQLNTIEDIKNKISQSKYKDWNYYVEPQKNDSVDLWQTSLLANPSKKSYYIGNYQKDSFQINDLKETSAKDENKRHWSLLFSFVAFCTVLGCLIAGSMRNPSKTTKDTINMVKEHVMNPIKDSLQKVGKDTLDLTKQLMKK